VGSEILLFSQRQIADLVAYSLAYEFEDTIAEVTGAKRLDATDRTSLEFSRRAYKLIRLASGWRGFARRVAPLPKNMISLEHDVELFFPVFNHPIELYSLTAIRNWRRRSRKAACFITEAWSSQLPEYLFELLSEFDYIFLGVYHAVPEVARITGRPCMHLPLATDVLRFTPKSPDQPRPIVVCNIGRRSQVTHEALLNETERLQWFYFYDTVAASGCDLKQRTFRVDNPREHRMMLATLLKHSCFFIANRGYINDPALTLGYEEESARFYEGAAAGTVMIGEAPRTEEFRRQFNWPDAVIHVPFDCPEIGRTIADLNSDLRRLRDARRRNAREAARRHDWLHRIRVVFEILGLPETEGMQDRAHRLEQIATRA